MCLSAFFLATMLSITQQFPLSGGLSGIRGLKVLSNILFQTKARNPQPKSGKPANVVKITKIDDKLIRENVVPQVGHRVNVEGVISDPNRIACFVVHPRNVNTWWVQNLPGPPDKVGLQWRISGLVYCGTETLGVGEEFDIVILTETKLSVCQEGKQFKTADFPKNLIRSGIVKVRRTRN